MQGDMGSVHFPFRAGFTSIWLGSDDLPYQTYMFEYLQSSATIGTGNFIEPSGNVSFTTPKGGYIQLLPRFHAEIGSEFVAFINHGECGNEMGGIPLPVHGLSADQIVLGRQRILERGLQEPMDETNHSRIMVSDTTKINIVQDQSEITENQIAYSSQKNDFLFYILPNPTTGVFSIQFKKQNSEKVDILLLNSLNIPIFAKRNVFDYQIKIDISDFPKGIYYLNVITEQKRFVQKIVKY